MVTQITLASAEATLGTTNFSTPTERPCKSEKDGEGHDANKATVWVAALCACAATPATWQENQQSHKVQGGPRKGDFIQDGLSPTKLPFHHARC